MDFEKELLGLKDMSGGGGMGGGGMM